MIQDVLSKYSNVFDTTIKKTMNIPDAELNLVDGYRPTRCYTCRPTPLHFMETADKLLADLVAQGVIEEAGDTRSEWCSPAHFVPKLHRVPLALCLVCDFTNLNSYLIRDQPATFPTGDDISRGSSDRHRHQHNHMVHFSSSSGDSSDDEDDQESVSFEDMLEQARAQSDIYSAEEDSGDEDFEPYTFQYERMYEDSTSSTGNCSTRQESSV